MILLFILYLSVTDIESLYVNGEYEKIIEYAPLFLKDNSLSQTEIIKVNEFYAASLITMNRIDESYEVFYRLFDLQPHYRMDRVRFSPKIIKVCEEARRKKPLVPKPDTVYVRKKTPITALFPGVYQIQRNKRGKGYVLLTTGILSLAALSYSQYRYTKSHNEYLEAEGPQEIEDKYEIYDSWHKKRIIFISTTTIIWLYNIVDALFFQ